MWNLEIWDVVFRRCSFYTILQGHSVTDTSNTPQSENRCAADMWLSGKALDVPWERVFYTKWCQRRRLQRSNGVDRKSAND